MTNLKRLGEKVKHLRKEKGLTQEKLAELANIDPKTIIEIENARRRNPTLKTLNKIAKALNTTLTSLLS
ncbi:MAG: helix-turn-helix transcriptional regulator [Patescibacteria group bacterium]